MSQSNLVDSAKRLESRFESFMDRLPPRSSSSSRSSDNRAGAATDTFRTAAQRDQQKRTQARSVRRKMTDAGRSRKSGR